MENSKVRTFIGFSIKKRAVKMGVNACYTLRRAHLILICPSASENTVKDAKKLAKRLNCKVIRTTETLEKLTGKENLKVMAITDEGLSKAVMENSPVDSIVED